MKAIKDFDEFIKKNIVKEQSPDFSRAAFLLKDSDKSYKLVEDMVNKMGISDETANLITKSCYDVLMELIRALMLRRGYNASGFGAHEAEVSFLRKCDFSERDVQFADQLRYFRSGMLYYGSTVDSEYAKEVLVFTKETVIKLKEAIGKQVE